MRKPDYAHKLTDAELAKLEHRIAKLYKEAADELTDTVKAYFDQFEKRDAAMKEKLDAGEITDQQYKQWRLAQMGRGKRFTALRDKVAERYTNANETAVAYVNDATPGIYTLNRNYAAYKIEQVSEKADFTLWDEQTVKRLIVEQPDLMPYYPPKRALQRGIDLKYGKQQITGSVTSSILQGKGIGKIADDLQSRMQDMNRTSAIRTARTAVTAAENAGRLDTYRSAQDMGIKLKKRWLATLDNRTRHAHAEADGQKVDVDKPFIVDGYKLMMPGDKSAPGYLQYNCRCTTEPVIPGINEELGTRRARDPKTGEWVLVENKTYAEWAGWKKENGKTVLNDLKGLVKPVTIKSIKRVKVLPSKVLDEAGQKKLQQAHKDLLQEVMNRGGMVEVARCYDMNMEPLSDYSSKNDSEHVTLPTFDEQYIVIHNHPSGLTLSPGDLFTFSKNENIQVLTIVGNNGSAYSIEKSKDFNRLEMLKATMHLQKVVKSSKNDTEAINKVLVFLQRGKEYGFIYNR